MLLMLKAVMLTGHRILLNLDLGELLGKALLSQQPYQSEQVQLLGLDDRLKQPRMDLGIVKSG